MDHRLLRIIADGDGCACRRSAMVGSAGDCAGVRREQSQGSRQDLVGGSLSHRQRALGCTVFGTPMSSASISTRTRCGSATRITPEATSRLAISTSGSATRNFSNYRRELDIGKAVQTVTYVSGGVTYTREYIASYPDQVMAFRFTADKPGALSGEIWLDSMHRSKIAADQGHSKEAMAAIVTKAAGQTLTLAGESKDLFWWPVVIKKGLRGREYRARRSSTSAMKPRPAFCTMEGNSAPAATASSSRMQRGGCAPGRRYQLPQRPREGMAGATPSCAHHQAVG
jgi:hypothetical protein